MFVLCFCKLFFKAECQLVTVTKITPRRLRETQDMIGVLYAWHHLFIFIVLVAYIKIYSLLGVK